MNSYVIRPSSARDRAAIERLLNVEREEFDVPEGHLGAPHGQHLVSGRETPRTFVAADGGTVVGVGTIWESWLHPARWRADVIVHQNYRRCGVGSRLFRTLTTSVQDTPDRPSQAATWADNHAGARFLQRFGFAPIMQTRLGLLRSSLMLEHLTPWITADTSEVARLEIVTDRPLMRQHGLDTIASLAKLHEEIYRAQHQWNLPRPLTATQSRNLFLDPNETLPEALFVARRRERNLGVVSLRRTIRPDRVDLGWIGTVLPTPPEIELALNRVLLGRCLEHAVRQEWDITVEVDQANQALWRLLEPVSMMDDRLWLTYATDKTR